MNHRLNFVILNWDKWQPYVNKEAAIDDIAPMVRSNEDVWVALTYFQLLKRGAKVTATPTPASGAINVVDGIHINNRHISPEHFLVGCRGDGHYPALCQVVLHQNADRPLGRHDYSLAQWVQPGLLVRANHSFPIRKVGFFGHAAVNLLKELHAPSFSKQLRARGFEFVIRSHQDTWNDYSDIDVVLAIRNIPLPHLRLKPANKLLNAWLAGVPAIIGREPAIQALRRSSLDYIEATDASEVIRALTALRANRDMYEAMIANGLKRAEMFNDDAVADAWRQTVRRILPAYEAYARLSRRDQKRSLALRKDLHRNSLRKHARDVHARYRGLGFRRDWWASSQPPMMHSQDIREEKGATSHEWVEGSTG